MAVTFREEKENAMQMTKKEEFKLKRLAVKSEYSQEANKS